MLNDELTTTCILCTYLPDKVPFCNNTYRLIISVYDN